MLRKHTDTYFLLINLIIMGVNPLLPCIAGVPQPIPAPLLSPSVTISPETLILLCRAETLIILETGQAPSIEACTQGIHPTPTIPKTRGPLTTSHTHNPTPSPLHDLWLEAAATPMWPHEESRPKAQPESQQTQEEREAIEQMPNAVAMLFLQKSELDTIKATSLRAYEEKEQLWHARAHLKNNLLVYYMAMDLLEPKTPIPHRNIHRFEQHWRTTHAPLTRPASPRPYDRDAKPTGPRQETASHTRHQ